MAAKPAAIGKSQRQANTMLKTMSLVRARGNPAGRRRRGSRASSCAHPPDLRHPPACFATDLAGRGLLVSACLDVALDERLVGRCTAMELGDPSLAATLAHPDGAAVLDRAGT